MGHFQLSQAMNAILNIIVLVICFSVVSIPGNGISGRKAGSFLTWVESTQQFAKWSCEMTLPPAVYETSSCRVSSLPLEAAFLILATLMGTEWCTQHMSFMMAKETVQLFIWVLSTWITTSVKYPYRSVYCLVLLESFHCSLFSGGKFVFVGDQLRADLHQISIAHPGLTALAGGSHLIFYPCFWSIEMSQ